MTPKADQETGEILDPLDEMRRLSIPDEQLVACLAAAKIEIEEKQELFGHLEQELHIRAAARGATTIYGKGMNYVVTTKLEYDRTRLQALGEFLTNEEFSKCYTPAHEETVQVPDKWDMTQWKAAARRHGGELQASLDALTFPGKASGKLVQTEETK